MKTSRSLLSIGVFFGLSGFAAASEGAANHHLSFELADADSSGGLTVFEFATTQGSGTPLVEIRRRFLPIDVSGAFEMVLDPITGEPVLDPVTGEPTPGASIPDGLISLEEWEAYRALEEKPKSTLGRFDLADFDGDGQLSLVEFGYLVSPKVRLANVMRKFAKLDDDGSTFIDPSEFKKSKIEDL